MHSSRKKEKYLHTSLFVFYMYINIFSYNWYNPRLKYPNNYISAVVLLYSVNKTYLSGLTIMFTNIITSNGLNSTLLADIQNKGYNTCD